VTNGSDKWKQKAGRLLLLRMILDGLFAALGVVEFEVSYNVASVAGKMLILSSPEVCVAEDLGIATYLPPKCVCACTRRVQSILCISLALSTEILAF